MCVCICVCICVRCGKTFCGLGQNDYKLAQAWPGSSCRECVECNRKLQAKVKKCNQCGGGKGKRLRSEGEVERGGGGKPVHLCALMRLCAAQVPPESNAIIACALPADTRKTSRGKRQAACGNNEWPRGRERGGKAERGAGSEVVC